MKLTQELGETFSADSALVKEKLAEDRERFELAMKKMVKDKRFYMSAHGVNNLKIEKFDNIQKLALGMIT